MKSSPHSENIGQDAVLVVAKATEMFITQLTLDAAANSRKFTLLEYRDLATVVNSTDKLEFLTAIIPKKITVKEYKEILENATDSEFDSLESSSSDDESGSEDESGDEDASSESDGEEEDQPKKAK